MVAHKVSVIPIGGSEDQIGLYKAEGAVIIIKIILIQIIKNYIYMPCGFNFGNSVFAG
jgi:hypothetical protein